MDNSENFDIDKVLEEERKEARNSKKLNIMLIGKSGVGKSTLINAIFGEDLAETGVGKPVTQNLTEYAKEGEPYSLIDTKGLEMKAYETIAKQIMDYIESRKTDDPAAHIHLAWYCINDNSRRIEDGEINIINKISQTIPLIIVMTQSFGEDSTFAEKVKDQCPNAKHVIRVMAQKMVINSDLTIGTKGLDELILRTEELLPEAQKKAFACAQKISLDLKRKHSQRYIISAAAEAGVTGASPIPFSDAPLLAGIQLGMLLKISRGMGLNPKKSLLSTLLSSALGISAATYAGKTIVTNLLKFIPGAGTVIGGIVSGTTAASLTTIVGEAYLKSLYEILSNGNENPSDEEIASAFKNNMKHESKPATC